MLTMERNRPSWLTKRHCQCLHTIHTDCGPGREQASHQMQIKNSTDGETALGLGEDVSIFQSWPFQGVSPGLAASERQKLVCFKASEQISAPGHLDKVGWVLEGMVHALSSVFFNTLSQHAQ